MRAANEANVEQARNRDIVEKFPLPLQQGNIFEARDGRADQRAHDACLPSEDFSAPSGSRSPIERDRIFKTALSSIRVPLQPSPPSTLTKFAPHISVRENRAGTFPQFHRDGVPDGKVQTAV